MTLPRVRRESDAASARARTADTCVQLRCATTPTEAGPDAPAGTYMADPLLKITGYIDTTKVEVELDEFRRADECVAAVVGILRAVGYADASIKSSLLEAAQEIET